MEFVGTTETFSFNELEVKGVKEYFISGYISTKSIDKFNDLITDECLEDMTNQINNNSIKIDYEHETIHSNNLSINPIARIVEAKKDDKGVWVKAVMNPSNNKFNEVWSSIKQGFLDSFSIAFKPIEAVTRYISGKAIRVLNKLKLINVGITGTPVNDDCKLDNVIVKALDTIEYLPLDDLSDEELELKHKYIKRTGSTGNYKYFYREDEQRDSKRELFKEIADKRDQGPKSPEERRSLDSQIRDRIATLNENKKKQIKEHESNIAHAKEKLSNLKNPENPSEEKEKKYWEGRLRDFESQRDATESHYDEKIENTKEAKEIKKDEGDKEESGKDKGEQFKETTKKREEGKETTSEKTKEKFYGSITRGDIDLNEAAQSMGIGSDIKDPDKKRVKIKEKLDSMSVDRFKQLLKYHGWAKEAKELEQKSTSYSTEESEDNNTMANEEKPKDEKLNEDEVDTKNEDAELEDESEDKSDEIEDKSDDEDEDDVETKGVIDALTSEVKSLKSQLAELKEKLSEPEFKALQQPITKLKENVTTPLSLIG